MTVLSLSQTAVIKGILNTPYADLRMALETLPPAISSAFTLALTQNQTEAIAADLGSLIAANMSEKSAIESAVVVLTDDPRLGVTLANELWQDLSPAALDAAALAAEGGSSGGGSSDGTGTSGGSAIGTAAGGDPTSVATSGGTLLCFLAGTSIATPGGDIDVEALRPGNAICLADGGVAPVRWIGRQTVSTRFGDPLRVLPIRIRAGALGPGLPRRDLLLSPDHALYLDGILVQAGALVNGTNILREPAVPEVFTYYHVELEFHALLLAEGVAAESFVDNADRRSFDNWSEHEQLCTGQPPIREMAIPRAKARRQVPRALRERLEPPVALAG